MTGRLESAAESSESRERKKTSQAATLGSLSTTPLSTAADSEQADGDHQRKRRRTSLGSSTARRRMPTGTAPSLPSDAQRLQCPVDEACGMLRQSLPGFTFMAPSFSPDPRLAPQEANTRHSTPVSSPRCSFMATAVPWPVAGGQSPFSRRRRRCRNLGLGSSGVLEDGRQGVRGRTGSHAPSSPQQLGLQDRRARLPAVSEAPFPAGSKWEGRPWRVQDPRAIHGSSADTYERERRAKRRRRSRGRLR